MCFLKLLQSGDPDLTHVIIPSIDEVNRLILDKIANSHKQIAGTIKFSTWAEVQQAMIDYTKGSSFHITNPDGDSIEYSKANAVTGDIIIISSDQNPESADFLFNRRSSYFRW